jgi:hypothetical protein
VKLIGELVRVCSLVVEVLDLEMKNKKKGFGGSMEKLEF